MFPAMETHALWLSRSRKMSTLRYSEVTKQEGIMKKYLFTVIICLLTAVWVGAQEYQPTWESLDSRQTPGWYRDAKFGIFIHWGLYSVPSWSPRGTYAEWYWNAKDGIPAKNAAKVDRSNKVNEFHNRVYGEDLAYKDFRPDFTCEMFDPSHWKPVKVSVWRGTRWIPVRSATCAVISVHPCVPPA